MLLRMSLINAESIALKYMCVTKKMQILYFWSHPVFSCSCDVADVYWSLQVWVHL